MKFRQKPNLLVFALLLYPVFSFADTWTEIPVEFIRNYDGDSIFVNITELEEQDKNKNFRLFWQGIAIRLRGVDTPELRTKCENEKILARMAKKLVSEQLSHARNVSISQMSRGKYFRLIANVLVDGISLKKLLFDAGLAVSYDGGTKSYDWCKHPIPR